MGKEDLIPVEDDNLEFVDSSGERVILDKENGKFWAPDGSEEDTWLEVELFTDIQPVGINVEGFDERYVESYALAVSEDGEQYYLLDNPDKLEEELSPEALSPLVPEELRNAVEPQVNEYGYIPMFDESSVDNFKYDVTLILVGVAERSKG